MPVVTLPDGRSKDLTAEQFASLRQSIESNKFPTIPTTYMEGEATWQAACRRAVGLSESVVVESGPRRRPTIAKMKTMACKIGPHSWGDHEARNPNPIPSPTGGPPAYRRCECLLQRDCYERILTIHPGLDGALVVQIGTSPLTPLTGESVHVHCASDDVLFGHVASALWSEPFARSIVYVSDADLQEAARQRSFDDEDDRPADSIWDLVSAPDLVLIQPGLMGHKPKRDLILDALLVRMRHNKATWLLSGPRAPMSKEALAHVAGWTQVTVAL